ncbi:MAG: hypothetical protein ACREFJ_12175 [Acetobacteraceae bacterium]
MGVLDRLAADLPVGLGVAELVDEARTLERMISVGRTLRDTRSAEVTGGRAARRLRRQPIRLSPHRETPLDRASLTGAS